MRPAEALNWWAEACKTSHIHWYLDKQTLLCANGLDTFPPELESAQVRISRTDLPAVRRMIRRLPSPWKCKRSPKTLQFFHGDRLALTVTVGTPEESGETVRCENQDYPVFSGYRDYLSDVYGDYENGLTDAVGVGLTTREKEQLRDHQHRCSQALAFLQELSREFGLRYYLIAGSVLGAVRHGGFIPWDDDIDVGIRIEDLDRVEAVIQEYLPQRLPEGFSLKQPRANQPYPRMFSKICYQGRCCIDLWPLVPTDPESIKAKWTWYFARLITKVHYERIGYRNYKNRRLGQILAIFLNDRQALSLARWNERGYAHQDVPAYMNLYSIYSIRKETIPRGWLDTPATASFEGISVPVVGHTEEYLTHLYGDYKKYPAPWKRGSRHFERF